jgi:hypothetical protein
VTRAAFGPGGKTLLTVSLDLRTQFGAGGQKLDNAAHLRDAATGKPLCEPLGHPTRGRINAARFSADGRSVVTASSDGTARLWDAATGRARGLPMAHANSVHDAAISPDGRVVVTGSGDGTARLWDARTGRPLAPPLRCGGPVHAVAFSPDSRTVVVGGADGVPRLWRVSGPVAGTAGRLTLWVQTITGQRLDDNDGVSVLSAAAWQECRRRLDEQGGPPEQRTPLRGLP